MLGAGYGYQSIEKFVDAAGLVNQGTLSPQGVTGAGVLATVDSTLVVTAILEAGRISLDHDGAAVRIVYDAEGVEPTELTL